MKPDEARATLQFLERTSLAPKEIAAFTQIVQTLQQEAGATPIQSQGEQDDGQAMVNEQLQQ